MSAAKAAQISFMDAQATIPRRKATWPLLWGCLDLLYVGKYALMTWLQGRPLPLFEVFNGRPAGDGWAHLSGLMIASAYAAFHVSLLASGCLLVLGNRWGRYTAYCQTAFRIGLAVPSLFPIAYLFGRYVGFWAGILLIVASDAFKVYTLRKRPSPNHGLDR